MNKFANACIAQRTQTIFIGWMQRDFGMTTTEANAEWQLLCSDYSLVYMSLEGYRRASRKGFSFPTSRQVRDSIYMSLQNAHNHASFFQ